jgi:hypothetical protein
MRRTFPGILRGIKDYSFATVSSAKADLGAILLLNEYRARRQSYSTKARELSLRYEDSKVPERTKALLGSKGLFPSPRSSGSIHTLAFFPLVGWHSQLLRPLAALGPLSHFDSHAYGIDFDGLVLAKPKAIAARRAACLEFERYAARAASERPIDWVFAYASGLDILADTIDRIRNITHAPVIGMCLDDKQSWEGFVIGEQLSGQLPIAPRLDLAWTSARVACEWYMVEGGNPIHMPEGCDPDVHFPGGEDQDIDICFVGQAYGFRRPFIAKLQDLGLRVHTAGRGWPSGTIADDEVIRQFQRSKVVLGLGGIGWSADLKNVKGRDFDAPCLGTGPYLTSYNPELAEFFDIGREIVCFSSLDECVELAERLLMNAPLRRDIAAQGRARCLREHTWNHRFRRILSVLGILE